MDMSAAAAPIRGNLVNSPSVGAGAMRDRLGQSGEMTLTRVMSAGEAQATRDAHGALIPKGAAAKWLTIGGSANINSSGDTAHSQTVQWKLDANFRKVLLKPGMNYYNENLDLARDYVEPYWVWKDAEGANIAFSPVVVPIFNDMIVSVRVNGQLIDRH